MTQADNLDNVNLEPQTDRFPPLIKAAFILIFVNLLVMLWFTISISMPPRVPARTDQQASTQTVDKASPFEKVAVETPRKAVRRPAKVAPYFAEVVQFPSQPSDGSVN